MVMLNTVISLFLCIIIILFIIIIMNNFDIQKNVLGDRRDWDIFLKDLTSKI